MNSMLVRIALVLALAPLAALAQTDTNARKAAAADRYLAAVPVSKMLNEMYDEISQQVPPEKRGELVSTLRKKVRIDRIELVARENLVKVFSADELNALADFYQSKNGSSAMRKFGGYMAEIMPSVMQEIERAAKDAPPPGK